MSSLPLPLLSGWTTQKIIIVASLWSKEIIKSSEDNKVKKISMKMYLWNLWDFFWPHIYFNSALLFQLIFDLVWLGIFFDLWRLRYLLFFSLKIMDGVGLGFKLKTFSVIIFIHFQTLFIFFSSFLQVSILN